MDLGRSSKDGYTIDGRDFGDGRKLYAVVFKYSGAWEDVQHTIALQAEKAGFKYAPGVPDSPIFMWVEPDKPTLGDSNIIRLTVVDTDYYTLSIEAR